MTSLAERSLRVAMIGFIPDDDPHIIADMQAEIERLRALAKELSDALLEVAPMGGSECFIRRGDEYYADPVFFKRRIRENRERLHDALHRAVEEYALVGQLDGHRNSTPANAGSSPAERTNGTPALTRAQDEGRK